MSESREHDVAVDGVWHNDNTAGVALWCTTCAVEVGYWQDGATIADLAAAAARHAPPTPSEPTP